MMKYMWRAALGFFQRSRPRPIVDRASERNRFRPWVEQLEDRTVPTWVAVDPAPQFLDTAGSGEGHGSANQNVAGIVSAMAICAISEL